MPLPPSIPPGTQLLPSGLRPYSQQMQMSQLIGRCISENPDCSNIAPQWINDSVRLIYDRRTWWGLMVRGQVVSPQAITGGTANFVNGSPLVTGNGTTWDTTLIGRQIRVGFNTPLYTITAVASPTSLTLEFPWGWNSGTFGYFIAQYYYNLGGNIKYVYEMKNLLLGYRMWTNLNQRTLDSTDPWRSQQFSPYGMATMPPDQNGNYMIEMYPCPLINQAFPYIAYVQPPNLVNDGDNLPPMIRGDVVVKYAIAQALVWRGRQKNPYYNFERSQSLMQEFERELVNMANADESLYRVDLEWANEQLPIFNPGGAYWDATHAAPATMGGWGPLGQGWW